MKDQAQIGGQRWDGVGILRTVTACDGAQHNWMYKLPKQELRECQHCRRREILADGEWYEQPAWQRPPVLYHD